MKTEDGVSRKEAQLGQGAPWGVGRSSLAALGVQEGTGRKGPEQGDPQLNPGSFSGIPIWLYPHFPKSPLCHLWHFSPLCLPSL